METKGRSKNFIHQKEVTHVHSYSGRAEWLLCKTSMVSPSRTETTGPVKFDASTTEDQEMKKPKMDTERISSLRLKWRATIIIQLTSNEWSRKHSPGAASVHNLSVNPAPSAEIHDVMHEMPIIF